MTEAAEEPAPPTIGVDLGATNVRGAVVDRDGSILTEQRDHTGEDGADVIPTTAALVARLRAEFPAVAARDLGLELNFQLYFQSRDGTLNDDPDKMGGFYTAVQYGVLFPLQGLGYLSQEKDALKAIGQTGSLDTAQILRWYLGIMF